MSETHKPEPKKDVRDLTPEKDAKGGGKGHGGSGPNTAGRGKHHGQ